MFPMTITIHNGEQLEAVLKAMNCAQRPAVTAAEVLAYRDQHSVSMTDAKAAVIKEKTEETPNAKKSEASTPSSGTTSASVASAAPSGTGESVGEKTYTLDDAKRLTTEAVRAQKRGGVVKLLEKFGIAQAAKLTPEQITPFCQQVQELPPDEVRK